MQGEGISKISTLIGLVLSLHGMAWGMTADELGQRTGTAGGLCSFPRAGEGDERLSVELAKRPTFVVHLLSEDPQVVTRLRGKAESEGLLGRSLYVEQGQASSLPFADRLVDLLVVTDLRDVDLTPGQRTEWLRVLAPRRGAALVGRKADGKLSPEALKAWVKDLPSAKVVSDVSGVWALLRTDLPAGSDSWTHRCHGADNSQVSADTTLQDPFLTQWWGLPRAEGFWGTTVVSGNGRLFTLRANRKPTLPVVLTARSLTSGIVLWQRPLRSAEETTNKVVHEAYAVGRSCLVAAGDAVLLADRDGILSLDGETGAERSRLAGPKPGGQIKWMACVGGLLAVLAGEQDSLVALAYQTVPANPNGSDLAVYDLEKSKELWRETLPGVVDERFIAVRDDRLYGLVQGAGMTCRELRTGKSLWTRPDPEIEAQFKPPESKGMMDFLFSQPGLLALDEVLLLRIKWATNVVALSRTDGAVLWKTPAGGSPVASYQGGRVVRGLAVNGIWMHGDHNAAIELKTGKPTAGPHFGSPGNDKRGFVSSGCGACTATPRYFITAFGAVYDMTQKPFARAVRGDDLKSPCDIGSLVSDGMMITVPSQCVCPSLTKGYRVLASAGSTDPRTAPGWKDRLTVLDRKEPDPMEITDADWPTYRHDPQRSAASAATVGEVSNVLWRWMPEGAVSYANTASAKSVTGLVPDFMTTAPVAAGDSVWFASPDGTVRCVKAATGKEVWRFPTGAKLFAPPTIWKGRVLVGGGDGRIYGLDAATGRCLWKLLAAPVDRRLFWFGHLVGTWPVLGGVVVQDDVAYSVAGYLNGIRAYAIDPRNGTVLWEKDAREGSGGNLAVGAGKLWLSSPQMGGFDLKTGDWKSTGGSLGSEVVVLDGKWVITGGRRLNEAQSAWANSRGPNSCIASVVDLKKPSALDMNFTTTLPAWDAELVVRPPGYGTIVAGSLTAVRTADLVEAFASQGKIDAAKLKIDAAKLKVWTTERVTPAAFALAKDHLVVAYEAKGYKVSGFRRTDGSKAWTIDLPEQPVMNGLALDRHGRVLVTLCDGSVLCLQ
jgi:outer membrane protein assembly factor BamB